MSTKTSHNRPGRLRRTLLVFGLATALTTLTVVGTTVTAAAASAAPHAAATTTTLQESVYQHAEADLNSYPYSWAGGHGDNPGPTYGECDGAGCSGQTTYGLDCSGFTRWVYYQASGHDLLGPGSTDNQIAETSRTSDPVPGDLVFFGPSVSATVHVGIYIGNNQMIDAYDTGTRIQVNQVSDGGNFLGYWHYGAPADTTSAPSFQSSPVVQYGSQLEVYRPTANASADESDAYTPGKSWSGWYDLAGGTVIDPTAVSYGQQMQVFGRDKAGATYTDVYTPDKGWSGWQSLGGTLTSDPVAVEYDTPDYGPQMEVFGLAGNGHTYSDVYTSATGKWSGWVDLEGNLTGNVSAIQYGEQMQVYGRDSAGTTYSNVYTPGKGWTGWVSLGGTITTGPTAVEYDTTEYNNQMELFGVAANGQAYSDVYTPSTGKWSGWVGLGGGLTGDLSAVQYGEQMQVYGRDSAGATYSNVYTPGKGWTGWVSLGGAITTGPTAIEYDTANYGNQMEVYGQAANGDTYSDVYTLSTGKWSGWVGLGGS